MLGAINFKLLGWNRVHRQPLKVEFDAGFTVGLRDSVSFYWMPHHSVDFRSIIEDLWCYEEEVLTFPQIFF